MQERRIEALKEKAAHDPNLRLLSMHGLGSRRRSQPRSNSEGLSPHASGNASAKGMPHADSPSSSRSSPWKTTHTLGTDENFEVFSIPDPFPVHESTILCPLQVLHARPFPCRDLGAVGSSCAAAEQPRERLRGLWRALCIQSATPTAPVCSPRPPSARAGRCGITGGGHPGLPHVRDEAGIAVAPAAPLPKCMGAGVCHAQCQLHYQFWHVLSSIL